MKNKRLHWGIGAGIGVAVLVLFVGWFWSLGTVHAGSPPAIRIEPVKQPVEIRHSDKTEWTVLSEGMDAAPGDSVRTGAGGEARIVWGDRGATRVDAGSELTLETIPDDGTLSPGAKINMKLDGGRVWTRVIKLLDLGSSMQVESSNVVATVRGTSFGAAHVSDGAQFAVTQSVVSVRGGSGTSTLLHDNQWGDFSSDGTRRQIRDLNESDAWAVENRKQDTKDEQDALNAWRDQLDERASSLNRGPDVLVRASEALHLSLTRGEATQQLASAYAERRLAQRFADRNDLPAAFREYVRVWRTERTTLSLADRSYLEAVAIDDRIDDALFNPTGRDEAALPSIRADLIAFESTIDGLEITDAEKDGLRLKAEALHARIDNLGPAPVLDVPEIPVPTPVPSAGTQIRDTAKPAPSVIKPPSDVVQPIVYQRLQLLASPSTVAVGQTVALKLFGITSTGQAEDITSRASFSSASPGSFSGASFTPSVIGTATVNAVFDGRVASAAITVTKTTAPITSGLQGIAFQFIGATTLPCSGHSVFKVVATYGDGRTADVTMMSTITVSDTKLFYASSDGSIMSFCAATRSTATLTATYTESGVKKTAYATLTLEPDPKAATGGCTGRYCP